MFGSGPVVLVVEVTGQFHSPALGGEVLKHLGASELLCHLPSVWDEMFWWCHRRTASVEALTTANHFHNGRIS
ncbi:hypothetical protein DPEC_G00057020 [Dallia pectoralis]|uniref:Uncharacterized protein n=1 Tax=Dallia pectoralis TaxID=75939 RepID=A0ACC2H6P8_DALPE|nr:hypothetical protein DPEC_G00057020 [Dallia pectoralis]